MDDASGMRHPPGLKYMVTELFCNSAGGPEIATSRGYDEAKLGINPDQWPAFLSLVAETAKVWPTQHHRDLVLRICEQSKAEICFGLEGLDAASADVQMQVASPAPAFIMSSGCPFSGKTGGQCPFSGKSVAAAAPAPPQQQNSSSPLQGVQAPMAGRVLGSSLQQRLDELTEEDPDLCCPVSLMVFCNPVIASDGFTYEESMLKQLLQNRQRSPMTREVLKSQYRVAQQKRTEVADFLQRRSLELLAFAQETMPASPSIALAALARMNDYAAKLGAREAQRVVAGAVQLYKQMGRPVPSELRPLL
jgi:hypothetical protein